MEAVIPKVIPKVTYYFYFRVIIKVVLYTSVFVYAARFNSRLWNELCFLKKENNKKHSVLPFSLSDLQ